MGDDLRFAVTIGVAVLLAIGLPLSWWILAFGDRESDSYAGLWKRGYSLLMIGLVAFTVVAWLGGVSSSTAGPRRNPAPGGPGQAGTALVVGATGYLLGPLAYLTLFAIAAKPPESFGDKAKKLVRVIGFLTAILCFLLTTHYLGLARKQRRERLKQGLQGSQAPAEVSPDYDLAQSPGHLTLLSSRAN